MFYWRFFFSNIPIIPPSLRSYKLIYLFISGFRGHGGRVTLSPPTSEAGVRFPAWPQVGKLVVACRWSAVYSTEPWQTVCTGFFCPSNYPSWYDLYSVKSDVKLQINKKIFQVLRQHYTGHITLGSFVGTGNQYIQLVKFLYCKLPTIGKQLPTFPHIRSEVWTADLRGGRQVCYQCTTMAPFFPIYDSRYLVMG